MLHYKCCVLGSVQYESISVTIIMVANACPYQASTYYWFCIMCKPRLKCSLGSLARLSTLS